MHRRTASPPNLPHAQRPHIRPATLADLPTIEQLQRAHTEELGHIPTDDLRNQISQSHILIATTGGPAAAYLNFRPHLRWQRELATIIQIAVAPTHRRKNLASAMLLDLIDRLRPLKLAGIQANCAANLPANEFWACHGFKPICYMRPNNKRQRDVICWRLPLRRRFPIWMAHPPKRAGWQNIAPNTERDPTRKDSHARNYYYATTHRT